MKTLKTLLLIWLASLVTAGAQIATTAAGRPADQPTGRNTRPVLLERAAGLGILEAKALFGK